MGEIVTKARPLIDFQQHISEVDVGDAPADLFFQGLHTFREVLTFVRRHDQFPTLNADTLASAQLAIDTREQVSQFLCTVAQTRRAGGVEVELLTDVLAERRPYGSGTQERPGSV